MSELDDGFFDRADAHIRLSNDQMSMASDGKVSASMMYGLARFNAFISATGYDSREEMANSKEEMIKYFVKQYKMMLKENMDDYIENFDKYVLAKRKKKK